MDRKDVSCRETRIRSYVSITFGIYIGVNTESASIGRNYEETLATPVLPQKLQLGGWCLAQAVRSKR
jgi:hypothetical protein